MRPWTPTTGLQSSEPAREGGRTLTANSMTPFHYSSNTAPSPGRKLLRVLALEGTSVGGGECIGLGTASLSGPPCCQPQESSLLPLPDNISPGFHSGRNLCRGSGLEITVPMQDRGRDGCGVEGGEFCYTCLQLFFFLLI